MACRSPYRTRLGWLAFSYGSKTVNATPSRCSISILIASVSPGSRTTTSLTTAAALIESRRERKPSYKTSRTFPEGGFSSGPIGLRRSRPRRMHSWQRRTGRTRHVLRAFADQTAETRSATHRRLAVPGAKVNPATNPWPYLGSSGDKAASFRMGGGVVAC